MLHTVIKSPFGNNTLYICIDCAKAGSAILLIEDGVYGALKNSAATDTVTGAMGDVEILALEADVNTRGLQGKLIDGVKLIDYSTFVELTTQHDRVQAWL
jgi:tRNA 2-thiouridine synthesizing protein B